MTTLTIISSIIGLIVLAVVIYDLTQKRHAILRNFPIMGHFRYILEAIGPELRQYIVTVLSIGINAAGSMPHQNRKTITSVLARTMTWSSPQTI